MQELLRLVTDDFELCISSRDISGRQYTSELTLRKHGQISQPAGLRLSAPARSLLLQGELVEGPPVLELQLPRPLFFENTLYQFEWIFRAGITAAGLEHRNRRVNEGFLFTAARGPMPPRLTGSLQTGNDLGWLRLPLCYHLQGTELRHSLAVEILPTKMLLQRDLPAMYRVIDQSYPLWRFSLTAKTSQGAANSRQRGNFQLLWLAQFARLRKQLEQGLQVIRQAPHSRLQASVQHLRADRIKGRVSRRLGERVREGIENRRYERRYRVEKKQLSLDTPENRFIRMVVSKSRQQLGLFEQRLRQHNRLPERQRLSDAFLDELGNWQQPLQKMLDNSFLKEVGDYAGMSGESLVLQQKTGYSTVYRAWQELRLYLDVLAGQTEVSMKSVAEIYEIWCFLRIRQMLLDNLGFTESRHNQAPLKLDELYQYQLKDGLAGAFRFTRPDGVTAYLSHERVFRPDSHPLRSYLVTQKPDIVLEVVLPGDKQAKKRRFIWLFDAKYRIRNESGADDEDLPDINPVDFVPDDAINQMHRYRDALIHLDGSRDEPHRSRPVYGAFALYPGYFPLGTPNPYAEAIHAIGIGAFPLLPDAKGASGGAWLLEFLVGQIGSGQYSPRELGERLYVQDAVRIPPYGLRQSLYPDLCLTAALAGQKGRDADYFRSFEQGSARWYHMPVDTFSGKYRQHVFTEIRYLAVARTSPQDSARKQIEFVWPVLEVSIKPRNELSREVTGTAESSSSRPYYLFRLGKPLRLPRPVHHVPHVPIQASMKLVRLAHLESGSDFHDLPELYRKVVDKQAMQQSLPV